MIVADCVVAYWYCYSCVHGVNELNKDYRLSHSLLTLWLIIIESRRQRRSVASTWNADDGAFSADVKSGTVADLLYPRVARATWVSAPVGVDAGTGSTRRDLGQCTMSRCMIVKSHHMTEQWVSPLVDDIPDTGKIGGSNDIGGVAS